MADREPHEPDHPLEKWTDSEVLDQLRYVRAEFAHMDAERHEAREAREAREAASGWSSAFLRLPPMFRSGRPGWPRRRVRPFGR
jgi:hypothetical protein